MKAILCACVVLLLVGCSGSRMTNGQMTAQATAFNLLGFPIPFNDYEEAVGMIPPGAQINTTVSSPRDWSSIWGIINSLIGFTHTQVSASL